MSPSVQELLLFPAFGQRPICLDVQALAPTMWKNLENSRAHWSRQLAGATTMLKRCALSITFTIAIIAGSVFPIPGGSLSSSVFDLLAPARSIIPSAWY